MTKNLYALAWILLTALVFVSILSGTLTATALLVYSLAALALVYGLALWSVIANTRRLKTE